MRKLRKDKYNSIRYNKSCKIIWRKKITYIEIHLLHEIERRTKILFNCVYTLPGIDTNKMIELKKAEKAYWKRYIRFKNALGRAVIDHEPTYKVIMILTKKVPHTVAHIITRYIV